MTALVYSDIGALGPWVDDRHRSLFERTRRAYGNKPLLIDANWRPARKSDYAAVNGGIAENSEALTIFLNPSATNIGYTLAHELGHAILSAERDTPTMRPANPRKGSPERRLLGELLSLLDHPNVHDLLRTSGFAQDLDEEIRVRALHFLERDIPTFPRGILHPPDAAFAGMGYANMIVTFRDLAVLPKITKALGAFDPRIREVGDIFASGVQRLAEADSSTVLAGAILLAKEIPYDATSALVLRSQIY